LWPVLVAAAGAVLLAGGVERRGHRGAEADADSDATRADSDVTG
jgi:hypothetical protein